MLRHFAEPRAAHGGIAAEGALNLLGRPEMDPLIVLVREAVQNSWDARSTSREPVHVELGLLELNQRQRRALTEEVFLDLPPHGLFPRGAAATTELADALDDTPLQILTVTDRGTTGLGGPIRADTPAGPDQSTDFVDLVFNIGQPRDSTFGGGTYGFGKTISYLVSRCRTVIIHTRTMDHGLPQHRLIAQAIGQQYSYQRRNYTGRHWWGRVRDTGAVEPLTGRAAEALAGTLGLPSFESGTGTTIAIVAPDLGDRSPEQAMTFLAEALTWNFWPKMIGEGHRRPSMHFAVSCNGEPTPVPEPARTPPLHAYVQALEAVRGCESGRHRPTDYPTFHIHEIRSQRPRALLGWLALQAVPSSPRPTPDEGTDERGLLRTAAAFAGPARHVALMRRAELVVQYREGPALANSAVEWVGVFKASVDTDEAFAQAEPPTHDDWRPAHVTDRWMRRYVNIALRQIKDRVNDAFAVPVTEPTIGPDISGVVVADQLGHLLAPVGGTGGSPPSDRNRTDSGGRRIVPKLTVLRQWLQSEGDLRMLNIEFTVAAADGTAMTVVEATAGAATADGSSLERDPPEDAPTPRVTGFRRGDRIVPGDTLHVSADDPDPWCVAVEQPAGVAAVVDLRTAVDGSGS